MNVRYLYNTQGESPAFVVGGDLFSAGCEWLGTLVGDEVYNVDGSFIGWIDECDRLVRPRSEVYGKELGRPRRPMRPPRPIPAKRRLFAPGLGPQRQDVFESLRRSLTGLVRVAEIEAVARLQGCRLVAGDETYLGAIYRDASGRDSIGNPSGPYGDPGSPVSIFNEAGDYGSLTSPWSPFNPRSETAPRILRRDEVLAHLTVSRAVPERIDPNALLSWLAAS